MACIIVRVTFLWEAESRHVISTADSQKVPSVKCEFISKKRKWHRNTVNISDMLPRHSWCSVRYFCFKETDRPVYLYVWLVFIPKVHTVYHPCRKKDTDTLRCLYLDSAKVGGVQQGICDSLWDWSRATRALKREKDRCYEMKTWPSKTQPQNRLLFFQTEHFYCSWKHIL